MKKTTVKKEVLKMRFEDIYGRYDKRELSTEDAAEILGISVRTFLRKRTRYEEEGFEGFYDKRLGKTSPRRAEDAEVERITKLYSDKYRGFNVKHFHEFARREHSLKYGYTWGSVRQAVIRCKVDEKHQGYAIIEADWRRRNICCPKLEKPSQNTSRLKHD